MRKLTDGDEHQIVSMARDGVRHGEIAANFGVHPATVGRIARDAGVHRVYRLGDADRDTIARLFHAGETKAAIARRIGVSTSAVRIALFRAGLVGSSLPHGSSRYHLGCRCDACRAAGTAKGRRWSAAQAMNRRQRSGTISSAATGPAATTAAPMRASEAGLTMSVQPE